MITKNDDVHRTVAESIVVNNDNFRHLVYHLATHIHNEIIAEDRYISKVQQLFVYFVYKCTLNDSLKDIDWLQCIRSFHYNVITKMVKQTLLTDKFLLQVEGDNFSLTSPELTCNQDTKTTLKQRQNKYLYEKLLKFHYSIYLKILQEIVSNNDIIVDTTGTNVEQKNYIDAFKQQVINISDKMRVTVQEYIASENNKYVGRRSLPPPENSKRTTPRRNRTDINYKCRD